MLARVGEVRSLIPSSVHVMALTATATSSDRIAVTQMIRLQNPYTLKQTPSKPNIVYHIGSFKAVPDTFQKFADRLRFERAAFPKTIIYSTSFSMCAENYLFILRGASFCQPPGCTRHPRIFTSIITNLKSLYCLKVRANFELSLPQWLMGWALIARMLGR